MCSVKCYVLRIDFSIGITYETIYQRILDFPEAMSVILKTI